jgi:hypothetical protein
MSEDAVDPRIIHADPSKAFFIDMLTRDISVIDCILDLIDNAVDKAVERSGTNVMDLLERGELGERIQNAEIQISFSADRFEILDTCGGISVEEARNRVFLFGNPGERGADHGLSVYGIGMKRAFFKLGNIIRVHSRTDREFFDVTINVPKWKAHPHQWEFEFDDFGQTEDEGIGGTRIEIPSLREGIGERLSVGSFERELRNRIASTYGLFLLAGIRIVVNGTVVESRMPTVAGEPFRPVRRIFDFEDVEILIIASLSPRHDRTAHGWYVFCNGRMVLEADKTSLTGWGDGMPNFHSKYNHFVGLVYFGSTDVRKLPWRTTKQGVEKEAPVYQAGLNEMRIQARPIIDYLNTMYPSELEAEGVEERELLDSAPAVTLPSLSKAETTFEVTRPARQKRTSVNIQFKRPREMVESLVSLVIPRFLPQEWASTHSIILSRMRSIYE